jgi:CheY-like chemotaxis protein
LADDADDDVLLLSRLLERAHIPNPVIRCRHGREAILRLIELWTVRPCGEWPRLLLLDLSMPVMDGFAVLQWLRERPTNYGLSAVMLSSSDDAVDILRARALGAAGFLVKYLAPECLAAIVKSAASGALIVPPPFVTAREVPRDAHPAELGPVKAAFSETPQVASGK